MIVPNGPSGLTAGTTGYDALADVDRILIDPAGRDALDALDILDTAPEPAFEAMVDVACALFATPIAVVSFVDVGRQVE